MLAPGVDGESETLEEPGLMTDRAQAGEGAEGPDTRTNASNYSH